MIELMASVTCDRCGGVIANIYSVQTEDEALKRFHRKPPKGYWEDEDGNDVCAACWAKWDAEHPVSTDPIPASSLQTQLRAKP